jgi:hypothetical protein
MSIKPVLVPDHTANDLRRLMDHFTEATTGPTRQELTESRAAVAAAQGVTEGSNKTAYPNATVIKSKNGRPIGEIYQDEPYGWGAYHYGADNGADSMSSREQALAQLKDMHDEYRQKGVAEGLYKDTSGTFVDRVVGEIMNYQSLNNANPKFADLSSAVKSKLKSLGEIKAKQIYQQALKQAAELSGQQGVTEGVNYTDELRDKMQWLMTTYHMRSGEAEEAAYYDQDPATWKGSPWEDEYTGVTEARPDVMRHQGDTTVKVVKRAGKPIGEIGIDAEASSGNGPYYVKLYDGSYDAVGFDSAAEALAELKYAIKSSMSESAAPNFKPGDRVQFTSPRGAVEDGVVVKDLYSGAVEVKFDSGETRGVYANSLKPLPAAVAESIDPVEQLRADILRFAR